MVKENFDEIKKKISQEKKIVNEINLISNYLQNADIEERKMIQAHLRLLDDALKRENEKLGELLGSFSSEEKEEIPKTVEEETKEISPVEMPKKEIKKKEKHKEKEIKKIIPKEKIKPKVSYKPRKYTLEKIPELDKWVLKRLKKKEKDEKKVKEVKPSSYIKFANKLFGAKVREKTKDKKFVSLEKDLIKSNLGITPVSYISIIILTTIISFIVAIFIFTFFLFFDLEAGFIIVQMEEDIFSRILKIFWIPIVVPVATLIFTYLYPSMERKSIEGKINIELPFATVHMAAISGSRIEPTKIFRIIVRTREYPNLEKEFNKLLNEINIYGYDLVTALKDSALKSPSQKLADLFNGLATTITSGGDLYSFFEKRSQTLLFDYHLEREKQTKTAETFMDIYISVVIAAPMILMLLFVMMKVSGLGISISTGMLTFLVAGGVTLINVFFIIFLQLKQPAGSE